MSAAANDDDVQPMPDGWWPDLVEIVFEGRQAILSHAFLGGGTYGCVASMRVEGALDQARRALWQAQELMSYRRRLGEVIDLTGDDV